MSAATIVVAGALANKAGSGGEAWVRMSWLTGFQRVGFDVRFVEQLSGGSQEQIHYFRDVVAEFGVTDVSTLIADGRTVLGPPVESLFDIASSSPLVNISGHLDGPLRDAFRTRIYIDIDPGFTQIWHEQGLLGDALERHTEHLTIGENIGTKYCDLPTGGFRWRPTRQPVVLDQWPVTPTPESARFTTVANWRGPYGPVEWQGHSYGLKVHEFRKFIELPRHAPGTFEVALSIDPSDEKDRLALIENGWKLTDPVEASSTPTAFREYVMNSGAEFSVAQGMYVDSNCGWFSDRSVRYLAAGKPVIVQDTGFGTCLPVGEGLLPFSSVAGVASAIRALESDYEHHALAARSLAQSHFDAISLTRAVIDTGN
ncbi:MAG: hypothetical protein QOC92_3892 [Acidimicrobiaceae bacterium]